MLNYVPLCLDGPPSLPFEWDWLSGRWHSKISITKLICHLFPSVATGNLTEDKKLFNPPLSVVWFPSQSVSIENSLCLYGEFGDVRVATDWGERDTACLTYKSFSMKSFNLTAEFWYIKPTMCCLAQAFLASYLLSSVS